MQPNITFSFVNDLIKSLTDKNSFDPERICCSIQGEEFSYTEFNLKIEENRFLLHTAFRLSNSQDKNHPQNSKVDTFEKSTNRNY